MKILLLCKKFPFPLKDGESIAVHTLGKALSDLGCEVSLLAMNTSKHYFKQAAYPPELEHYHRIETVEVDNRIKPLAAFANLFSQESYHIARFVSPEFSHKLRQMLQDEDYDVVQLETLYLAPYLPIVRRSSDALVVMRAHNVEHEIWERITGHAPTGLKRWYLQHLTEKLRRYETMVLNDYDLLVPITHRDLKTYRRLGFCSEATVTPIGLASEDYLADYDSYKRPLSISFIGSLDWMPNLEGLQWFIDEAWPKIQRRFPQIELHIAGRNTPDSLFQMRKNNIHVHGEVPDASAFINQHSLMVVPLLSGSGMRAKILEGMALGKVVISTSLGLEGIPAEHRKEVFHANTPDQFVEGIAFAVNQGRQLEAVGRRAKQFVHSEFDRANIARRLLQVYQEQVGATVNW